MESERGGIEFSVDIGELMSLLPEVDDRHELAAKTVSPLTFLGVAGEMTLAGVDGETVLPLTTSGELCIKSSWLNVEGATPKLSGIMTLGFNTFARIVASVLLFCSIPFVNCFIWVSMSLNIFSYI